MSFAYLLAPLVGYVAAGGLKFVINSLRVSRLAFDQIGLGGMPSTHTSITSTVAALLGFREGIDTPAFAVAVALVLIVVIDAMDLRRKVGRHAVALKRLFPDHPVTTGLRDRIGHSTPEIFGGIAVGLLCGWLLFVSGL